MVPVHVLQPAQVPLMCLSSVSPHWPFGVGNCASHGQFLQIHNCTDREKTMEIIFIWIPSILIGIHVFPYHPSEAAVFTSPSLAVLCSLLSLTRLHSYFSTCVTSCARLTLRARLAGWAAAREDYAGRREEQGRLVTGFTLRTSALSPSESSVPGKDPCLLPPLTAAAEAHWPCTNKRPQPFTSSVPAQEHSQR